MKTLDEFDVWTEDLLAALNRIADAVEATTDPPDAPEAPVWRVVSPPLGFANLSIVGAAGADEKEIAFVEEAARQAGIVLERVEA